MAQCIDCYKYKSYNYGNGIIHICIIQATSEDPGEIAESLVTRETDCGYFIISDPPELEQ